ncbi:MAG: sulfur carrier protein ThiS [Deltaproteobacteria bacterium]|nr:sulfur carrier protein ThiS [Deltaproteobacteria bacterium]
MQLTVNGKREKMPDRLSVFGLLKERKVGKPEMVSIELNKKILRRNEYEETYLKENDRVEILFFVGGGAQRGG